MHRALAIFMLTMLSVAGALHYPPLWLFVLVMPAWALIFLRAEDQRIRGEMLQRVRERIVAAEHEE